MSNLYFRMIYLNTTLPVNFHLLKNTFTEQLSAEGTVQGPESTPARKNGEQKPRNYSSWMWSHLNKRNLFLIASIYAEQVNKNCPIDRNWFAVSHPHWLNRLWHTRFELGRSLKLYLLKSALAKDALILLPIFNIRWCRHKCTNLFPSIRVLAFAEKWS